MRLAATALVVAFALAQDADLGPPPGRMVDIGERQLHLHCTGSGSPTVILEAGASSFAIDWTLVQPEIAKTNRVCSYDRAGSGWSSPLKEVDRPTRVVADLRAALGRAGEKPPYIMVGASFGALYVRLYQLEYASDVAGFVLVDPATEDRLFTMYGGKMVAIGSLTTEQLRSTMVGDGSVPNRAGTRPPQTGSPFDRLPKPLYDVRIKLDQRLIAAQGASLAMDVVRELSEANRAMFARLLESRSAKEPPMRNMPTIVLTRGMDATPGIVENHAGLAKLSQNSRHTVVPNAGHEIHLSAPAVVIQAIQDVVASARTNGKLVNGEFIFDTAPFASAHASTIAESRDGLVAAWFGGTREGASDVGIWVSRKANRLRQGSGGQEGAWTPPVEVATGVQPDGTRHPCWNPVLYELRRGELTLFYKVGPSPQTWWGMMRTSQDGGQTWSEARRLPDGFLGPVKNKPVRLANGTVIAGSSTETPTRPSIWRVHFERSVDNGNTWTKSTVAGDIDAIQPSILIHADGRLQAIGRTRAGRVFETWSSDNGTTWSAMALTMLPNPSAGTDALTLADGRHLIVYNHTEKGRSPLNVALSRDGQTWASAVVLESEPGEYSYPAVIQGADGLVHITYTWRRQRVKHVVIDPSGINAQ